MTEPEAYRIAFDKGREAVRCRPYVPPCNPYDEDCQPDAYRGWENGAISAGITTIYTNGELNK